jgi:response regulator RpfG family c-di-GMP phosphodiesterase
VRCSSLPYDASVDLSDRSYFLRAIDSRDFSIGDYQVGRITNKASINFGFPILDDRGNPTGVAYAAMDLSWLRRMAVQVEVPSGTALSVVDANGTILSRSLEPEKWVGYRIPRNSQIRRLIEQRDGFAEITDIDGVRRLCAVTALRAGRRDGVYLCVGIPSSTAFAEVQADLSRNILALVVVALFSILAAWFGGHALITRRVDNLVHAASRLGEGDLGARAGQEMNYGRDEIGELARVFDTMAESIEYREDQLRETHNNLASAVEATIEGWARALERRDSDTQGHTRRVAEMAVRLSRTMEVPEEYIVHIRRGALLHDIGKMAIPDAILLKPGPLNEEEWSVMKRHPTYAYEWLSHIPLLNPALEIPFCHHERWDGSGYPRGLVGVEIPLAARIFAVVDNWDAVTTDRPYRDAWSEERALHYIEENSGKLFDPRVVDAFVEMGRKTTRNVETLYRTVESSSREATEELVESPL